jgi:hypothetical protein
MLENSVFIADCLCGRHFESPTREYVCPVCQRHIVLEWGHDPEPEPERSDRTLSTPEAA